MEEFGCLWSYQEVGHTLFSFSSSGSCLVWLLKVFFFRFSNLNCMFCDGYLLSNHIVVKVLSGYLSVFS